MQRPLDVDMALNMADHVPAEEAAQSVAAGTAYAGTGQAEADMTDSKVEDRLSEAVRIVDSAALPCAETGMEGKGTAAAAPEDLDLVGIECGRSQDMKALFAALAVARCN
jgi:hypothetical protein